MIDGVFDDLLHVEWNIALEKCIRQRRHVSIAYRRRDEYTDIVEEHWRLAIARIPRDELDDLIGNGSDFVAYLQKHSQYDAIAICAQADELFGVEHDQAVLYLLQIRVLYLFRIRALYLFRFCALISLFCIIRFERIFILVVRHEQCQQAAIDVTRNLAPLERHKIEFH